MSVLATILIVLGALLLLLFVGGLIAARRRARANAPAYARHLAEADQALEQARASDRGWDRAVMEQVARDTLGGSHPGTDFDRLELVLVDDRPGVTEDTAHFEAASGDQRVRVVLTRDDAGHWSGQAES